MKTYSWKVKLIPYLENVPVYRFVRAKTYEQAINRAYEKFAGEYMIVCVM